MHNLGLAYLAQDRIDDGVRMLEEVLRHRRDVLGESHSRTLVSVATLASGYREMGRLEEARDLYTKALSGLQATIGERHAETCGAARKMSQPEPPASQPEAATATPPP